MTEEALLDECRQRQEDEIIALQSIYAATHDFSNAPDTNTASDSEATVESRVEVVSRTGDPVLKFHLPIQLPRPTRIVVESFFPQAIPTPRGNAEVLQQGQSQRDLASEADSNGRLRADASSFRPKQPRKAANKVHSKRLTAQSSPAPSTIEQQISSLSLSCGETAENHKIRNQPTDTSFKRLKSPIAQSQSPNVTNQVDNFPSDATTSAEPALSKSTPSASPLQHHELRRNRLTHLPPLAHLAPITLQVRLPPLYPASSAPIIEELQAPWLTSHNTRDRRWIVDQLLKQCSELEGLEVLWTWVLWLSEGLWRAVLDEQSPESLGFPFATALVDDTSLGLKFEETLSMPDSEPLLPAQLLSHARLCSRSSFDSSSFDCGICLETRKGKACTKVLGCGHIFCSDCLKSYLSVLVDEGYHRQVRRCPDPECVKMWGEKEKLGEVDQNGDMTDCHKDNAATDKLAHELSSNNVAHSTNQNGNRSPTPVRGLISRAELEQILSEAQLKRLDTLTIKARMEADPSVSYCPREDCQAAVVRSSSDEGSGHWERFRECQSCGFAFCAWCSRSWHGPTSCPISFQTDLIQRYISLAPGSAAQLQMQQKFGKKTLETMVQKYLEEQETKKWLADFTTPCPTCGISIEKSYGCNHMTCKSCLTHYCYLCGKSISGSNPYGHFNTPGYDCYNRLFDGLLGQHAPGGMMVGPDGVPVNPEDMIPWEELV